MMKRLLFVLAMLWSVAYGQSKGYLRYDSLYIQKIGGNGELIIENGTRNVTGGVLTNMGNGRTQFVMPSGGGGDDSAFGRVDTLLASQRYVNQDGNAFLWKNGKLRIRADLEPFGPRYIYDHTTVVDNTPSATATIDASGIRLVGGGANILNSVKLADSVAAHRWTFKGSFVANDKNSTSISIAIAFNTHNNGQSNFTYFNLADSALSGYISAVLAESLPTGGEANTRGVYALKWSALDTFDFELTRDSYKGYVRLGNRATNSAIILDIPQLQGAVSDLRIYTQGGDWKILNNLTLTYNDPKFPKWIFCGDSISTGLTGDNEATTPYNIALDGVNDGVVDFSAASTQSADGLYLLKDLRSFIGTGTYVFIPWAVNDRNAGININTYAANLRAIRDAVIAAGGIPVFVNGVPQTSGSIVAYNDTMRNVANEVSALYIDIYTALVGAGTAMNSLYDWGDGIHLNQKGNNVMGNAIRQALVDAGYLTTVSFDSPVSIGTLPVSARHNWDVTTDGNNLYRSVSGTNPGYIWSYKTLNANYRQPANISLADGYGIWAGHAAIGGSVQSSPYFSVNTSGQTNATSFSAGNASNQFMYTPSSRYFYGNGGVQLLNGMFWNPSGQGFVIRQTTPSTSNVNLIVNTTSGNTIASHYKIASFGVNTDTSSWIDRKGGFRSRDTTSGYAQQFDYTQLGEDDWITKNITDSLIAAAVLAAGGATPGGSNGQVQYNNSSAFGGITGATSNGTTLTLVSGRATTDFSPSTNDGAALGTSSLGFSDLFLATGAVINFGNGNLTGTHSSGQIEWSGNVRSAGNFRTTGAASAYQVNDRSTPANLVAQLYGNSNVFHINVNSGDRLSIDNNGRVGIGATSPTAKLELTAGSASANTAPLEFNSGAVETTIRAGLQEYNGTFYQSNSALNRYGIGGVIYSSSTSVSNSGTSATTLSTYTTKANTLNATEESIYFEYSGTVDDASPISLVVSFAGTTIATFAPAGGTLPWTIKGRITRTGANTATAYVDFQSNTTSVNAVTDLTGLTFSGTNILLLTGTSTTGATDDIVKKTARLRWEPAPAN